MHPVVPEEIAGRLFACEKRGLISIAGQLRAAEVHTCVADGPKTLSNVKLLFVPLAAVSSRQVSGASPAPSATTVTSRQQMTMQENHHLLALFMHPVVSCSAE